MYNSSKQPDADPMDLFLSKSATDALHAVVAVLQNYPVGIFDAELRVLDALEKICEIPEGRDGIEAIRRMTTAIRAMRLVMVNESEVVMKLVAKIMDEKK